MMASEKSWTVREYPTAMLAAAFREVVMEFDIETAPESEYWAFLDRVEEFLEESQMSTMSDEEMGRAFREWLQRGS